MQPRPVQAASVAAIVPLLMAGCLATPTTPAPDSNASNPDTSPAISGLKAEGAQVVRSNDTVTFAWKGKAGPGGRIYFYNLPDKWHHDFSFDVGPTVGYAELNLSFDGRDVDLNGALLWKGMILCAASNRANPDSCSTPLPRNVTKVETWQARVESFHTGTPPRGDIPFAVKVTLHPRRNLTWGSLAGAVDPSIRFQIRPTGYGAWEPSMGVLGDGALFALGYRASDNSYLVLRSRDDGATWQDVTPIGAKLSGSLSYDPFLFVDMRTNRVIVDHDWLGCSWAVWSDDGGETWPGNNPAVCGVPLHDYPKLAVGDTPLPLAPYNGIIYHLHSGIGYGDVIASRSLDGGLTWQGVPALSPTLHQVDARRGGGIAADLSGHVFVPAYAFRNEPRIAVAHSKDHGASYAVSLLGNRTSVDFDNMHPTPAVDRAGNAYVAWAGPGAVFMAASTDHGASWRTPVRVTPPQIRSATLVDVVAGGAGRVALTFLGTPDSDAGPNEASGWSRWYLFVAFAENALADSPVWRLGQVTPDDDPVQVGTVCTHGGACTGSDRNLGDFFDVQAGPDGRVYVAYTDACSKPPCAAPSDSRDEAGYIAVQTEGPRLWS